MNRFKINLAVIALLLGCGAALAMQTPSKKATVEHTYGRLSDGTWIELNDSKYECNLSEQICKGTFSYQNPGMNEEPDVRIEVSNASYQLKTP